MKRFAYAIAIAGIALIVMSAVFYFTRPGSGDPAPEFELKDLSGQNVSLSDFKGRPVILHFFATWCEICRHEFASFKKMSDDFANTDLAVIVISEDDPKDLPKLKELLASIGSKFIIVSDEKETAADAYKSYSVPESFLVDRNGIIRSRISGEIAWQNENILKKIRALIGEGK